MKLSNRNRVTTAVATLVSAALLVAGCSSTGNEGSPAGEGARGDLTVWVGSWWDAVIPGIVGDFAAEHPNISPTMEALPVNGYVDTVTAAALGGLPPDVFDLDSTWLSS